MITRGGRAPSSKEVRAADDDLSVGAVQLERAEDDRALLASLPLPHLVTDPDGNIKQANRLASKLFGVSQSGLQGRPLDLLVSPLQRVVLRDYLRRLRYNPTPGPILLSVGTQSDTERRVEGLVSVVREVTGRPTEVQWILRELSARSDPTTLGSDRLALLAKASFAGSLDYLTTLRNLARVAVPELADWCIVDVLEGEEDLRQIGVAHVDPGKEPLVQELRRLYPPDPTIPHPIWRVITTGRSLLEPDIRSSDLAARARDPRHYELLRQLGVRSHIVVPLSARGQILGAMSFVIGTSERVYDERDLRVAEELAARAGVAVDNARLHRDLQLTLDREQAARREAEAAQVRLAFLAEASDLLAGPLDTDSVLKQLARVCVASLTDLCVIDLLSGDGSIQRVAAVHADPEKQHLADLLRDRYPPVATGSHPAVQVIRTGRSLFSPELSPAFLKATTRDRDHLGIVVRLGCRSFLSVPLKARGRTLGALTFISTRRDRRYGPTDVPLAEDLARRAGLVMDNVRLFEQQRKVAHTLQDQLLPRAMPHIPGIELAGRYRPAGDGVEVGGDFYDAFQVGPGDWFVSIGDVCGKGPEAAAVTGLTRHTLRASARHRASPAEALAQLNEELRAELTDGRFCTVCCVRVRTDGITVRATVGTAGHPLPLLLHPNGGIERVGSEGTLLGVFERISVRDHTVDLAAGDALVLYTDGVVDQCSVGGLQGEAAITALLRSLAREPAETIAQTLETAILECRPQGLRDDIAVVVLRIQPGFPTVEAPPPESGSPRALMRNAGPSRTKRSRGRGPNPTDPTVDRPGTAPSLSSGRE